MKFELSKEWCMASALLEGDSEVGAGLRAFDPMITDESWLAAIAWVASDEPPPCAEADEVAPLCDWVGR